MNVLEHHQDGVTRCQAPLADLLSIPTGDRYPPLNLTPQKRKEKTLHAQLAQVEGVRPPWDRTASSLPAARLDLRQALVELQAFKTAAPEDRIIFSERDIGISPKALAIGFLTRSIASRVQGRIEP
jgi:cytidylate kinase